MAFTRAEQSIPQGHVVSASKNRYTIQCSSGEIYRIKRPGGRLGTQHFSIMTKAIPTDVTFETVPIQKFDEDGEPMWKKNEDGTDAVDEYGDPVPVMTTTKVPVLSPGDLIRIGEAFETWASSVLPHIIMEGLPYDEMPGEDQYGIFMGLFNKINMDREIFRFIDDEPLPGQGEGTNEAS